MASPRCRSTGLAILLIALAALSTEVRAGVISSLTGQGAKLKKQLFEDLNAIKQHSFHTPLLEDYTENGLYAWSFGASAVVTDQYVQLTPAAHEGHGYLWNQYPSQLKSFKAHFSYKLAQRPHSPGLFGSTPNCDTCGVAFWAIKEPVRQVETLRFYGVPSTFLGFGVVITHEGQMHLVWKDIDGEANSVSEVSIGHCVMALSTSQVDIVLEVKGDQDKLTLHYAEPGASSATQCVSTTLPGSVPERYYYGFTAYALETAPVAYQVINMMLVPIDGASEAPLDAAADKAAVTFDAEIDKKERQFWHEGRPDEDPRANHRRNEYDSMPKRHFRDAQPAAAVDAAPADAKVESATGDAAAGPNGLLEDRSDLP